jgi:hypothetical protein
MRAVHIEGDKSDVVGIGFVGNNGVFALLATSKSNMGIFNLDRGDCIFTFKLDKSMTRGLNGLAAAAPAKSTKVIASTGSGCITFFDVVVARGVEPVVAGQLPLTPRTKRESIVFAREFSAMAAFQREVSNNPVLDIESDFFFASDSAEHLLAGDVTVPMVPINRKLHCFIVSPYRDFEKERIFSIAHAYEAAREIALRRGLDLNLWFDVPGADQQDMLRLCRDSSALFCGFVFVGQQLGSFSIPRTIPCDEFEAFLQYVIDSQGKRPCVVS